MTTSWLEFGSQHPPRDVACRLFCFPSAGSGASAFLPWSDWLSDKIDLVAVQLPGRETRLAEPLLYSMDDVAQPLADAMTPLLDRPFAFFGHSTGALISFEVARVLRRRRLPEPDLLFVSSQNAPSIPVLEYRHTLDDDEFIEIIRNLEGTPEAVLQDPEILKLILPRIRADGAIYETYSYIPEDPLNARIVAVRGDRDAMVSDDGIAAWKAEAGHSFHQACYPGGHFFFVDGEEDLSGPITSELEAIIDHATRSGQRELYRSVGL